MTPLWYKGGAFFGTHRTYGNARQDSGQWTPVTDRANCSQLYLLRHRNPTVTPAGSIDDQSPTTLDALSGQTSLSLGTP